MIRQTTITLGQHRGRPRVYLQGKWLARARFVAGAAITATFASGSVTVALAADGDRKVSGKANGVSVIDINADALSKAFNGIETLVVTCDAGTLTITPSKTAQAVATRCRNGKEGSLFSGAGFLSQAAKEAGYEPAWACEIDTRYAETYAENHPEARVYNVSVHELPIADLAPVELLTIGIPCEPFSAKRRSGDRTLPPEAHELGDMVFWALRVVEAVNPATVIIEEVPGFLESGAGWIARHALERMGYSVAVAVVGETGDLAGRRRAAIVATTGTAPVIPAAPVNNETLGTVLESVPDTDAAWFTRATKAWLFEHWEKQTAKGNGFGKGLILTADTTRVPCISKRYFNGQGDAVVVAHPTKSGTFRWLTVREVARLHGVPDTYSLPEHKTVAGEVLGQAVVIPVWRRLIAAQGGARG